MTQLCQITGDIKTPEGVPVVATLVSFTRVGRAVGIGERAVVPSRVEVQTNGLGELSVSLFPGAYVAEVNSPAIPSAQRRFAVGVPEDASAFLRDLIEQSPPFTPNVVAQVLQAADDAEAAAATASAVVGSGNGQFPDGTATAPAVRFASGLAMGLFRAGANILGFATGGTERARLGNSAFQVNVPITGTAVTQSETDTTPGRIPINRPGGIFGWGATANVPDCPDLDDNTLPAGLYRTINTTSNIGNRPSPGSSFGYLLVIKYDANGARQIWGAVNVSQLWHRDYRDGAWQPWRRLYDSSNILGTVSQSGGVPTGAVLNGNASAVAPAGGHWERTAAGFQRVHRVVTTSDSANTTVTFTQAFLAGSTPAVNITPLGDSDLRVRLVSVSATAVVFSVRDSGGSRVAVPAHVHAAGRWSDMI